MTQAPQIEVATLPRLDREALLNLWRQLHDREPPRKASREFLRRHIAYRIQEVEHGGLKPNIRRHLDRIATGASAPVAAAKSRMPIKPGTRLLRTWHGKAYEVNVVEHGFMFQNERYRSLSAVARAITGTRWNGWTFFGLKEPQKAAQEVVGEPKTP